MIKKITLCLIATIAVAMANTVMAQDTHAEINPIDFALMQLEDVCALSRIDNTSSVEDIELTQYCLNSGEVIVLQAAASIEQIAHAKFVMASWAGNLNALLLDNNAR